MALTLPWINDIKEHIQLVIKLFADDSRKISNPNDQEILQNDLEILTKCPKVG